MVYTDTLLDELHDAIFGNGHEPRADYKDQSINYNEDGHFYLLTKLYDIYSFLQGDIMFIPNLSFTIENSKMILTFEMKLKKLKWLLNRLKLTVLQDFVS